MRKNKVISTGIIIILLIALVAGVGLYFTLRSWPLRFKKELNTFFGEGNWEKISAETNESKMYSVHHYSSDGLYDYDSAGTYTKWYLLYTGGEEEEIWTITDHTYRINHSKYSFLSPKCYSAKQALVLELMEISCDIAAEEVQYNLLTKVLSEEQAECLRVNISYHNGNPSPSFYDQLAGQDWFNVNESTAEQYLKTDLYEFYIDILLYDYKFSKLSEADQEDLLNSLDAIEQLLLDTYGEYADYEIYLGEEYSAETSR
ncbi:MAG: hypothetical protein LUC98_06305 [Lachnospiraceae bacterium]|nr:hypothetical protein [Lachnospiraceae bacterium]